MEAPYTPGEVVVIRGGAGPEVGQPQGGPHRMPAVAILVTIGAETAVVRRRHGARLRRGEHWAKAITIPVASIRRLATERERAVGHPL